MRIYLPAPSLLAFAVISALIMGEARSEVALRWDSTGHVVVPTIVNGHPPVDFIFDTGADESGVYAWYAKSLGLPAAGSAELSGATGSIRTVRSHIATLSVDGHTIANLAADTLPDRPDGAKVAGVVGVDLMAGRIVVLDFDRGTAALLAPTTSDRIAGKGAQLVMAGSIPDGKQLTLPVTLNGARGLALLDTGSRATIINFKFASAAGLDPSSGAFHDGDPTRGASQDAVKTRVGPIGTVRFAGIVRQSVQARIVDMPFLKGSGLTKAPVMVLGVDLLRGTRLTVDYSKRRFWVAPSTRSN